jgi:gluconolactonase
MTFSQLHGAGFEVIDPRFNECFFPHERIERLWTGGKWCEGPAWFAAHRMMVWSDIPNNRLLRYDEISGRVGVFRQPANNANGNTVDRQGRLVTCEHLSRQVVRTEHDGRQTMVADQWQGKRLNSPNDLVIHSDGSIWFTDPDYGILSDYEGQRADSDIGACHVYRVDPQTQEVACVADDLIKPNGLAFSPDERFLYIADTGASHAPDGPRHIRRFEMSNASNCFLGSSLIFAECTAGLFDGFRVDTQGRIWTSAADGVHAYSSEGELLGKIRLPEVVANLCFGGPKRNRLFICATSSIYSCHLTVTGQ